jgi:hypothetical protein
VSLLCRSASPDNDPTTFKIILNIIHSRTRKVPRQVTLEVLTNVCFLVDKYQLHEVVALWSDTWIESLRDEIPQNLSNELAPWLSISWVFKQQDIFKNITRIGQRESSGQLAQGEGEQNLPIPKAIIGMAPKQNVALPYALFTDCLGRKDREEPSDGSFPGICLDRTNHQNLRRT